MRKEPKRIAHLRFLADKEYLGSQGQYYELLGVDPGAELNAIEQAYGAQLQRISRAKRELGDRPGLDEMIDTVRRHLACALLIMEDPIRRSNFDDELWVRQKKSGNRSGVGRRFKTSDELMAARAHVRGCAHFMKAEYVVAELLFQRAINLQPRNPMYHLELGWTILQNTNRPTSDRLAKAYEHLEFARVHAAHEPRARYCMAMYFKEDGARRSCRRELEAALRCDPNFGPARKELDILKKAVRSERKGSGALSRLTRVFNRD